MAHDRSTPDSLESNGQNTLPDGRVQELVQQFRKFLGEGDKQATLDMFNQLHPVDQGDVLVELARQPRHELLTALSPDESAEILENMEVEAAVEVFERIEASALSQILDETSPDVAADILRHLPEDKSRETLGIMEEAKQVIPLLQYPDDSAGGLMTTDYPALREAINTSIALDQLRLLGADSEHISSVFVVDDGHRLIGSLSVTRLALARPSTIVRDISEPEPITVSPETDQEECARLMERYDLAHLPVVDRDGFLKGVILAEDMVDVVEEEATEDMYRMAGLSREHVFGPIRHSLRSRLPWLHINLGTALLASLVISIFESTIDKAIALVVFLPVVAGQGGVGGTQTVTLVVRSMALGEIPSRLGLSLLLRELTLALINGVLLGVLVGLIAYAWKGNPFLGLVLGLAMMGNMIIAGLAGAGVPLLLTRLGMDPAVSSAVFVTTFTDVIGFLLFLGLAAIFIELLI